MALDRHDHCRGELLAPSTTAGLRRVGHATACVGGAGVEGVLDGSTGDLGGTDSQIRAHWERLRHSSCAQPSAATAAMATFASSEPTSMLMGTWQMEQA
jgi:hypothetical protein